MIDIRSLQMHELEAILEEYGEPKYRATQVYDWIHKKLCDDISEMTNISKSLQSRLACEYFLTKLVPIKKQASKIDGTIKYLFGLEDGNAIESVLMEYHHGISVCISSEVGCAMSCSFCASTIGGLVRRLTTSEMLSQIYTIQKLEARRVSNVVVMGTGEPLDNLEELVKFIKILSSEVGLNISQRNITVSTCGLVPEIYKLADEKLQINLALSLHAADDATRQTIMPIAKKYKLNEVMRACKEYNIKTGRRVTYEYNLIKGVNDTFEDAKKLISLIKETHGLVNIIPMNPVSERDYSRPDKVTIRSFAKWLDEGGINVTIRRELGADIDGACGQLRYKYNKR